ncbi:hypothetical protein BDV32DRAFT_147269 [Aspergillus pseudonomiae]|nr:hypothetical protein BDV32DRAFT_147269 [Aspergillus pseudonomiae]
MLAQANAWAIPLATNYPMKPPDFQPRFKPRAGADADAFRPERLFSLDPARYRFGFVRWGIGRDKCLGKNMAEVILKLAILAVTDKYTLHVPSALPDQGEKSEAGFTINRDVEVEFRPAI